MRSNTLGIAASLRNARWGSGSKILLNDIRKIQEKETLIEFVQKEADIHLENFVESGRKEGIPFDELYRNLRKILSL